MRVLEAGDWSLLLPPEWDAERDEDGIVIGDRDGIGCLEISELRHRDGAFQAGDLEQFREGGRPWEPVECGSFAGRASTYEEEGAAIREWFLHAEDLLLFVTYSCDMENRAMDDAAVDDMLSTLRYMPESD